MNTEKINTLEQIQDAKDIVENARTETGLNPAERLSLETASVKLSNLERSIIRGKAEELVTSLTSDASALKELANQINKSAGHLKDVASAIEKAASIVESFINITDIAVSAGLL